MTAYINGRDIPDREALHRCLAEQLAFPDYYGNNLDALYDLLSSTAQPVELVISEPEALAEHLGGYCDLFRAVLRDVREDNPNVTVVERDPEESGDVEAF